MTRQLRYTGCSAVVEIQRSGYPVALSHRDFVAGYRCIVFDKPSLLSPSLPSAEVCKNILSHAQSELCAGGESWLDSLKVQVLPPLPHSPYLRFSPLLPYSCHNNSCSPL